LYLFEGRRDGYNARAESLSGSDRRHTGTYKRCHFVAAVRRAGPSRREVGKQYLYIPGTSTLLLPLVFVMCVFHEVEIVISSGCIIENQKATAPFFVFLMKVPKHVLLCWTVNALYIRIWDVYIFFCCLSLLGELTLPDICCLELTS